MSSVDIDLSQYKDERHESSNLKLNAFRKDDSLCDVVLKTTGGEKINAHKCVLVSNSEYFERMFTGGFKESTQDVILIKDISNDVLKQLIDFMYTGTLGEIDEDNVEEVLNGADILQLDDVRNECIECFTKILRDDNCLMIKDIADSRGMPELSKQCVKHSTGRFNLVARSKSFVDADFIQLIQLLKNDDLNTNNEECVYKAVIKWVKHKENERKNLFPELFKLVRLAFIPNDYLHQIIEAEPLVYSNPGCLKLVKRVFDHYSYKHGDSLSKIITDVKPRTNTTQNFMRDTEDSATSRLPYYKYTPPRAPTRKILDFISFFNSPDINAYFPKVEWEQSMREDNFLKEWDEEWRGVHSPDEESDD